MWGAMTRVPHELIEILLLHADLEILESVRGGLPTHSSVRVPSEKEPEDMVGQRVEGVCYRLSALSTVR